MSKISEYERAVEALERIRLETSNVCVNTNLDIIEETLKQTKENVSVIEQYKKEKEHSITNALNILISQITKEYLLLELYWLLVDIEDEYATSDSILKKQEVLDDLRNVIEEIREKIK